MRSKQEKAKGGQKQFNARLDRGLEKLLAKQLDEDQLTRREWLQGAVTRYLDDGYSYDAVKSDEDGWRVTERIRQRQSAYKKSRTTREWFVDREKE